MQRDGVYDDIIGLVGNTPLVKLRKVSEQTGCDILGKAEFLNPGSSVKDRAALWIIRDAEKRGTLRPGGVIVEGTAGNTGIGLTVVGNALGYRTVIVMPETQSQEKKDMLRLAGAELVLVVSQRLWDSVGRHWETFWSLPGSSLELLEAIGSSWEALVGSSSY